MLVIDPKLNDNNANKEKIKTTFTHMQTLSGRQLESSDVHVNSFVYTYFSSNREINTSGL